MHVRAVCELYVRRRGLSYVGARAHSTHGLEQYADGFLWGVGASLVRPKLIWRKKNLGLGATVFLSLSPTTAGGSIKERGSTVTIIFA